MKKPRNDNEYYLTFACIKESEEFKSSPTEADVLCLFSSFIGSGKICEPGIAYIATRINRSERRVSEAIYLLEKGKFIKIKPRDEEHKTSIYTWGKRFIELGWDKIIANIYKASKEK